MAKPRLIILIRHAQSEGNKNRDIHQTIPDHRVKLTQDGWQQAYEAGRRLRKLLRADDTLHFFTSPYRRTRETTEGILSTLTSDEEDPSPFKRSNIKVYEEPRLREQDFGNFQPCSAEMERMWQERADYGHFFYRIPNGESAADAYDRVSGFNESLWRQFGESDFASVCVLVTHGLMSRVFLMKWYHFTVETTAANTSSRTNCELGQTSAKSVRRSKRRMKRRSETGARWRGSQSRMPKHRDCWSASHYQKREDLEALRQRDESTANGLANGLATGQSRHQSPGPGPGKKGAKRCEQGYSSDEDHGGRPPQIDVTRSRQEVVSSPDGTPSFISAEDRLRSMISPHLHVGRDFGGTYSGRTSRAGSDTDSSEEDGHRPQIALTTTKVKINALPNDEGNGAASGSINGLLSCNSNGNTVHEKKADSSDKNRMNRGARANRLGDAHSSDLGSEIDEDDLARAEKEDRSIQGSVY
ncbi:Broad-range acid phosphatase DET1 [Colletotrichum orbiculare MAFF 240422]|uniref:Broad-range acid phosphatase DET1 n=1 Tax=Colletotrichum orbiculare (strain 104-T / ATCC 96160 / CBS 514.97 / LARS 414 / MAFF 240422) TaxID=1213857 RepID=A0A484G0T1_COLOR|nr:Broad-range acid phosphatase DET1 [Colletotrichum orbiculare MAFF 240422]